MGDQEGGARIQLDDCHGDQEIQENLSRAEQLTPMGCLAAAVAISVRHWLFH
jgi:hypothetical protein